MNWWLNCGGASRPERPLAGAMLALLLSCLPGTAATAAAASGPAAGAQQEPELKDIVSHAIKSSRCLIDRYDSQVWFKLMEPKLRKIVTDPNERLQILEAAWCEANRPGEQRLPPGLIMAVMDVESRFNRWAVSSAGAVGLMQVMPFWPSELGMPRYQLTQVEANMRMGCAILRHYLKRERNDVRKALARYNGAIGKREYPDKVITRWTRNWNGADDLGVASR